MKILRPMLGQLRRALTDEARRKALDVGKAAARTVREDVRESPERSQDVKNGRVYGKVAG